MRQCEGEVCEVKVCGYCMGEIRKYVVPAAEGQGWIDGMMVVVDDLLP